jgi:DNA mismatch endonuclease, patch repair protein
LPKYRTVIFVNGCFWHGHSCRRGKLPLTNREFWKGKIEKNVSRDLAVYRQLESSGWKIIVVWTCKISSEFKRRELKDYLEKVIPADRSLNSLKKP